MPESTTENVTAAAPSSSVIRIRMPTGIERVPVDLSTVTLEAFRDQITEKFGPGKLFVVEFPSGDAVTSKPSQSPLNELGALHDYGTVLADVDGVEHGCLLHFEPKKDTKKNPTKRMRKGADEKARVEEKPGKKSKNISTCTFGRYLPEKASHFAGEYIGFGLVREEGKKTSSFGSYSFDQYANAARLESALRPKSTRFKPWVTITVRAAPDDTTMKPGRMSVQFRGENPKPREDVVPLLSPLMMENLCRAILIAAPRKRHSKTAAESFHTTILQPHEIATRWPPLLWSLYSAARNQEKDLDDYLQDLLSKVISRIETIHA